MTGMLIGRDTFLKYLVEGQSDVAVEPYIEPQQRMQRNALNVRFMDDAQLNPGMWEAMCSLDLCVDNEINADMTAERKAIYLQEKLQSLLQIGVVRKLFIDGQWNNTAGYISWLSLTGMRFKDVPAESYIHKNMTLKITYFVN